jgi:hypothetical protein
MQFHYCGAITVIIDDRTETIEFITSQDVPEETRKRCRAWAEKTVREQLESGYKLTN